jgi:DNA-binding GntR family transcriptional regulator
VKKLSVDQIIEIYYIRAALSGIAARLAARNLTEAEINQLFKLCDRMDADIEHGQSKAMLEDNLKFHSIIYKATKSRRLEELALQYHSQSEQYQALGLELPGRYAEICAEHRDLANALAAGDKEGAEFSARQHLFNTAKRIAANFQIDLDI